MGNMISIAYAIVKAIPAARDLFYGIQDLYYNDIYETISTEANDYIGERRALSNSIETAKTNEDLQALSVLLAKHERNAGMSDGHRASSGTTDDASSGDK